MILLKLKSGLMHMDIILEFLGILDMILFPSRSMVFFICDSDGESDSFSSSTSIIEKLQNSFSLFAYSLQASVQNFSLSFPTHIILIFIIKILHLFHPKLFVILRSNSDEESLKDSSFRSE